MASREAGTPVFYISAKHEIKSFILEYIEDIAKMSTKSRLFEIMLT